MLRAKAPARQQLSRRFAKAEAAASRANRDFIEIQAGFGRHAEFSAAEARLDILRRVAHERDLEIVDERSAVHGDAGDEAPAHQIDHNRPEANLDDVAAHSPEDGFALRARGVNRDEQMSKILRCEDAGKPIQKFR